MKYIIIISFLFLNNMINGQIPEKESILQGYYVGHKAFEAIQSLNYELIKDYYKDTTNLSFILKGIQSKSFEEDNIQINKDIMFNQETRYFEFIVFGGKFIPSDDDWGLYDYFFVIQYEIDLTQKERKDQILYTKIIRDKNLNDLKTWWQRYMTSYKEPKYAKEEIAVKYGLVPPPPPPPKTKEWFKK